MSKLSLLYTTLLVTAIQLLFIPYFGFYFFGALERNFTKLKTELNLAFENKITKFIDDQGQLYDTHSFSKNFYAPVELSSIDPKLVADVISVEDEDFYEHNGIDYLATARATFFYFFAYGASFFDEEWAESLKSGGSTISQQLVKLLLNHEHRGVKNKIKEIFLADMLEAHLGEQLGSKTLAKQAILSLYLNRIPVGHRSFGLNLGARLFFGKSSLENLSQAERITLLAAIQAPSKLIGKNQSRAQQAFDRIVKRLKDKNRLNSQVAPMPDLSGYRRRYLALIKKKFTQAQSTYARSLLLSKKKLPQYAFTGRNSPLSKKLQSIFANYLAKHNKERSTPCLITGAAMLVEIKTGIIKAAIEDKCEQFNELVQGRRQVMSTIKPFLYAQAIDQLKLTPATVFADKRQRLIDKLGMPYAPGNHYKIFKGQLTLKNALQFSSNTISLQLLEKIGIDAFAGTVAQAFALNANEDLTTQIYNDFSLALGAAEFSPAHVATAYLTLLNGGQKKYLAYLISDSFQDNSRQVLPQTASEQVREMLTAVVRRTGSRGTYFAYHPELIYSYLGGKSGSSKSDSWFIGFSQDLLLVVWLGKRQRSQAKLTVSAKALWPHLFVETQRYYAPRALVHNKKLERAYFCKYSGKRVGKKCKRIETGIFAKDQLSPELCQSH